MPNRAFVVLARHRFLYTTETSTLLCYVDVLFVLEGKQSLRKLTQSWHMRQEVRNIINKGNTSIIPVNKN